MTALHILIYAAAAWATYGVLLIGWLLWLARRPAPLDVVVTGPLRQVSVEEQLGRIAADECEDWLRDLSNEQVVEQWRGEP